MKVSVLLALAHSTAALQLNVDDASSVANAASLVAKGMLDYYDGSKPGGVIGMFSPPYYWWEAGVAWNALIDFWFFTGIDTHNDLVKQSLQFQRGKNSDYMPSNQSTTEGNDDQGFWGIAAMTAAERNFPNPASAEPGWLYLAQAVFNTMTARWDNEHCGGGLRWQIYTWNSGYDYKNTVSNGCLFNIAARLARYTGNSSYSDWAERAFEWLENVHFLDKSNGNAWKVWDGASLNQNCTEHGQGEWTYNYGLLLSGCAYMYDFTRGDKVWLSRAESIWNRAKIFFHDDKVMYEAACQPRNTCNNDQRCFKGIFSAFLGHTALFIPSLTDEIMDRLRTSAAAAAQSCSGGSDGHTCGLNWFYGGWDGVWGLGEQISALQVIQTTRVLTKPKPVTLHHGGTSNGSSNAGLGPSKLHSLLGDDSDITSGDRAGAGIATAVCLVFLIVVGIWMLK